MDINNLDISKAAITSIDFAAKSSRQNFSYYFEEKSYAKWQLFRRSVHT